MNRLKIVYTNTVNKYSAWSVIYSNKTENKIKNRFRVVSKKFRKIHTELKTIPRGFACRIGNVKTQFLGRYGNPAFVKNKTIMKKQKEK